MYTMINTRYLIAATLLINFVHTNTIYPLKLRPFRELAHGLRSGPIEILDNRTFFISNLHYDGNGPDAHFWVGKGEPAPNGTAVSFKNVENLPPFYGENVTLMLPDSMTMNDIDYLAMWCIQFEHNFGHVFINESLRSWKLKESKNFLQPLRQLAHFLQSGPIEVINKTTFVISHFYYDGFASQANFWVGKGLPANSGTLVPDEYNSTRNLQYYNGKNVTIFLPGNVTIDDIDYLAVWNYKNQENYGHVFMEEALGFEEALNGNLDPDILGFSLGEFQSFKHGLRSGPILILDERTFYIPNLHYDGKGPDAHFWVGNGSEPSTTGIKIPGENNVYTPTLPRYDGQSIYIKLPENLTVKNIEYLGVWCIQFEQNFGHVNIPRNLQVPKSRQYPQATDDGRIIVRVPKCCPLDTIVEFSGCEGSTILFNVSADIHMGNKTHLNDVAMSKSRIIFVPYTQNIKCPKYPLEPDKDNYSIVTSGNLLYISEKRQLSLDEYCLDTVKIDANYLTTAFVCTIEERTTFTMFAVFIFISCIFLITTAVLHFIIKQIRRTRGMCVIGYTGMMAISFFCLGLTQVVAAEESCHVLGIIFQFTIVSSFTWFTTMCIETLYLAKNFHLGKEHYWLYRRRRAIYIALAIIIPCIFFISSIAYNVVPLMPTSYLETSCRFTSDIPKKLFLLIPITMSMVINIIIIVRIQILVTRNNKLYDGDEYVSWIFFKRQITCYYRSCLFLVIIMIICWIAEVGTYLFDSPFTPVDIIHSLQGVFICIIILYPSYPRDEVLNYCGKRTPSNNTEMQNLNNAPRRRAEANGRMDDTEQQRMLYNG